MMLAFTWQIRVGNRRAPDNALCGGALWCLASPEPPAGCPACALLKVGAAGGLGAGLAGVSGASAPWLAQKGLLSHDGAFAATSTIVGDLLFYTVAFPTSRLILSPFTDQLPTPKVLRPVARPA